MEHEQLSRGYEEETSKLESITKQIKDANLRFAGFSARESTLRDEYSQYFDKGFERRPPLAQHPILIKGIADQTCSLCGAKGESVVNGLRSKVNLKICPLCNTSITVQDHPAEEFERLKEIDVNCSIKVQMNGLSKELDRLQQEDYKLRENINDIKERLMRFERENEDTMLLMKDTCGADALLSSYHDQWEKIMEEKREAEKRRGKCRDSLIELQRNLQRQYLAGEKVLFLPLQNLRTFSLGWICMYTWRRRNLWFEFDSRSAGNNSSFVA